MDRHAYLIMAHGEFELLALLLQAIDDERNDIYVHIDRKAKDVPYAILKHAVRASNLTIFSKRRIYWGDAGMIRCEYDLMKRAVTHGNYSYYHFISGVDFPIVTQDELHDRLKNDTRNYITYRKEGEEGDFFYYKFRYYYPFMKYMGKYWQDSKWYFFCNRILNRFLAFQKKHGINRVRHASLTYYKGENWFTLREEAVRYLLKKRWFVEKNFFCTCCTDEIFAQTLLVNSEFRDTLVNHSYRLIDWTRGEPYTYQIRDLTEILASDAFFVRKLTMKEKDSKELVLWLSNHVS